MEMNVSEENIYQIYSTYTLSPLSLRENTTFFIHR